MWVFTETGFVSAVRKPERPNELTIRSRDRQSLVELAHQAGVEIAKSPNGDYPYRIFVPSEIFAQWAFESAMSIDYSNFKSRIAKSRDYEYAHNLGLVWAAMIHTEDAEARQFPAGNRNLEATQ